MSKYRNKKQLNDLLSNIRTLIKRNDGIIDLAKIREGLLLDSESEEEITEKELTDLINRYSFIMGRESYKAFLKQKFENTILDCIELTILDENKKQVNRNVIRHKVKENMMGLDSKTLGIPEKYWEVLLSDYDIIFNEQYKSFFDMDIQKFDVSMISWIKWVMKNSGEKLDKDTIKQKVKEEIEQKAKSYSSSKKIAGEFEEILSNYDLKFDWAYNKFLYTRDLQKIPNIKEIENIDDSREDVFGIVNASGKRKNAGAEVALKEPIQTTKRDKKFAEEIRFVPISNKKILERERGKVIPLNMRGQNGEEERWQK